MYVILYTNFPDVKYAMAECHIELNQNNLAMSVLESVAPRTRTACLNMMLGNLYHQTGMDRAAVIAYKEVLKVTHALTAGL